MTGNSSPKPQSFTGVQPCYLITSKWSGCSDTKEVMHFICARKGDRQMSMYIGLELLPCSPDVWPWHQMQWHSCYCMEMKQIASLKSKMLMSLTLLATHAKGSSSFASKVQMRWPLYWLNNITVNGSSKEAGSMERVHSKSNWNKQNYVIWDGGINGSIHLNNCTESLIFSKPPILNFST